MALALLPPPCKPVLSSIQKLLGAWQVILGSPLLLKPELPQLLQGPDPSTPMGLASTLTFGDVCLITGVLEAFRLGLGQPDPLGRIQVNPRIP